MTINLLATNAGGQGNMLMIVAMVILLGFSYFAMIRPQKKQNDARMKMIARLKKGDNVILVDGLHGKVDAIDDKNKTIVVDADGIYLTFSRIAVRQVIPATAAVTMAAEETVKQDPEKSQPTESESESHDNEEDK